MRSFFYISLYRQNYGNYILFLCNIVMGPSCVSWRQLTFVMKRHTSFFVVNWRKSSSIDINWPDASVMTFDLDFTWSCTSVCVVTRRQLTSKDVVKNDALVFNRHFSTKIHEIFLLNFWNFENRQKTTISSKIDVKRHDWRVRSINVNWRQKMTH